MKKFFYGICIIFMGFTAVSSAEASFFIFKPNIITIQTGKTFTLPVIIDPVDEQQYTVRLSINFPPDLLEVTSFTFSQNWISLSQPHYDSLNNKQGELIKTGGFPKGFSKPISFGTITFRAKGTGQSAIVLGTQSFVLNEKNENTLESRPQIRIIITEEGQAPEISSMEPLPSLPTGEANIFDISLTPEQKISRPSVEFFLLLFIVALFLGIIGRIVFVRLRHRLLIKKMKHDEDN